MLVGDFGRGDTSIQVTGLKPGHYYNIRVVATNAVNFSSLGPLIRLRTTPIQPVRSNGTSLSSDENANSNPDNGEPASIRAAPSRSEPVSNGPVHQMIREPSWSQHSAKRTVSGRRNSPATTGVEHLAGQITRSGSGDEDESEEALQRLTEKLDSLRREQQEIEKQVYEEEHESKRSMTELFKERDHLKQMLKEKEESSSELRKHGNHLDKLNRTAQSKKSAREKILHQKKAERQKIKDDIARWDKEIIEMRGHTEEMAEETASVVAVKDNEVVGMRKGISEDQVLIKSLEEDIRIKGIQIKAMEKDRENPSSDGDEAQEHAKTEKVRDEAWEVKALAAQAQLSTMWQTLQQVLQALS